MTTANPNKKWNWAGIFTMAACLAGAPAARADLLLTVQSVTVAPGDVNDTFEVFATNLGTTAQDVTGFNFEIDTASADITFEQATTATTVHPYIFAGNSFFGPTVSTSSPGQTLDASDLAFAPNSFTVVNPGASFGLALVFFDVAPGTPAGGIPVTFNIDPAATNVPDQNLANIPLSFSNGTITVQSVPTPEPSSLFLMLAGGVIVFVGKRRRASRTSLRVTWL